MSEEPMTSAQPTFGTIPFAFRI